MFQLALDGNNLKNYQAAEVPDPPTRQHAKPVVYSTSTTQSLHFSWHETQSCMAIRQPDALHLRYTRTMMGFLLWVPEPATIAMVGLGGGSLAKFCHRHLPSARITVVEINPQVIALRDDFRIPADSARFSVVLGDGAEFMRFSREQFDVLLVDGYDQHGLPPNLGSQRFYDDCARKLTPGGILVANLYSGHADWHEHTDRIRRSFNDAILVVADNGNGNAIVFASKMPLSAAACCAFTRQRQSLGNEAWKQLGGSFKRIRAVCRKIAP